ncbi:histone-lysine N-methyltransferase SMYD3-like [Macrobrachium nipponense]|uniref:histone-lysine N-methyltransferase SMYD3-like n=1 Tax=Macrobrachium nipponense TaxID=159736 RepID=UPI0030C7A56D
MLRESMKERLSVRFLKPPALIDPNPCTPALSSAVEVSHWPNKGRGLIATRDIKPGEVLCLERAYAVGLGKGQLTTNCSTCTRECVNPLPCPGCTQVVFCSKSCRVRGLSEDHWLECKILTSVLAHHLESRACAYKLLKTFNCSQMISICNKLKDDQPSLPEQVGFDSTGKYSRPHFSQFTIFIKIMAAFKLYPTKSLVNHSCCPVMSHSSFGRETFVYAIRPIVSGEELTISYGDYFNTEVKSVRSEKLQRNYRFVCRCQACEENWPTTKCLPAIVLRCEYCNKPHSSVDVQCDDCLPRTRSRNAVAKKAPKRKQNSQVAPALRVLHRVEGKIRTGKPISKEEFRRLCEASEVAFKHSAMPSKSLVGFMGSVEVCADAGLMYTG